MFSKLKSTLALNLSNTRGWRTNRKIVVFESDDWGSIRMPNSNVFSKFIEKGYNLKSDPYCKFDTLASSKDLMLLFEVLSKYRDVEGNHPIITFNTVVANPAFDKIRESRFQNYYYEPFTQTLQNYYPNENVFELWREGMAEKLIRPQFHGREHVNVPLWLQQLNQDNKALREAFDLGFWGIPKTLYSTYNINIQASYSSDNPEHIKEYKKTVKEGLELFEQIFNFRSETFIANNYTWPLELNVELERMGVKGLQSMRYQKIPKESSVKLQRVYTGKVRNNQVYMVRNCIFEPSQTPLYFDDVTACLNQIKNAFFWQKPAIISMHRLNLIGTIDESNREVNLKKLHLLLQKITELWPTVNFLSSDELSKLIMKND